MFDVNRLLRRTLLQTFVILIWSLLRAKNWVKMWSDLLVLSSMSPHYNAIQQSRNFASLKSTNRGMKVSLISSLFCIQQNWWYLGSFKQSLSLTIRVCLIFDRERYWIAFSLAYMKQSSSNLWWSVSFVLKLNYFVELLEQPIKFKSVLMLSNSNK